MLDLNELREEINKVDSELVHLFEKRMKLVKNVAEYKIINDISVLNASREDKVIKRAIDNLKDKSLSREIELFFYDIMEISKDYQNKYIEENVEDKKLNEKRVEINNTELKIGFQGVEGSFSEEALLNYFGDEVSTIALKHFEDVFEGICEGKINYGILPVENSSTGSVNEVYDLLRKYGCYINGEIIIKVKQNLLGIKGAVIEDIKEVYSHSQGFQQSTQFFKEYPHLQMIPYHNTAISAKFVSETDDVSKAAVASKRAADIYGLDVIKENINFNSNNYTRFVIIGKNMEVNEMADKISVVLTVKHKSGSLCEVLNLFSEKGLNLLKIESRPIMNKSWEYFFHLDFEGNLQNPEIYNIIEKIKTKVTYFKVLGNYKKY